MSPPHIQESPTHEPSTPATEAPNPEATTLPSHPSTAPTTQPATPPTATADPTNQPASQQAASGDHKKATLSSHPEGAQHAQPQIFPLYCLPSKFDDYPDSLVRQVPGESNETSNLILHATNSIPDLTWNPAYTARTASEHLFCLLVANHVLQTHVIRRGAVKSNSPRDHSDFARYLHTSTALPMVDISSCPGESIIRITPGAPCSALLLHNNTLYKPMSTPARPLSQIHTKVAHDSGKIPADSTPPTAPYSLPLTNNRQPGESS